MSENISKTINSIGVQLQQRVEELENQNKRLAFALLYVLDGVQDHEITESVSPVECAEKVVILRNELRGNRQLFEEWRNS